MLLRAPPGSWGKVSSFFEDGTHSVVGGCFAFSDAFLCFRTFSDAIIIRAQITIPPSPKTCQCVRSRGVASTRASSIAPITTTSTPVPPADLSWCVRVAPDKRVTHRTTFLRCHRLCEALLDSSRIYCLVSGLLVLAWLAGCVFSGRGCRQGGRNDVVVVFVEQAHCHRPRHRSGRRFYVQSRRLSTLAGTCFVAPRYRTVVSGASPPAGSVGHRLGEGSQPPAFSCSLLLLGAALTLLVDLGGLPRVAGVTTTSVKCLQVYANVHAMSTALLPPRLKVHCTSSQCCSPLAWARCRQWSRWRSFCRLESGAFDSLEDGLLKVHPAAAWTSC
jgi:hypothetical protein